jgi:hypothetical protein
MIMHILVERKEVNFGITCWRAAVLEYVYPEQESSKCLRNISTKTRQYLCTGYLQTSVALPHGTALPVPTVWAQEPPKHLREQINICPWRETKHGFPTYWPKHTASHPRRQYCSQLPPWYNKNPIQSCVCVSRILFDKWHYSQNWKRTALQYGQVLVAKWTVRHTDEDFKPLHTPKKIRWFRWKFF